MVGSAQYADEEIDWVLTAVVNKRKAAYIQANFETAFGRSLNHNQVRYIKNKYGKDPRFNSPLVNIRPPRTPAASTPTRGNNRRSYSGSNFGESPHKDLTQASFGNGAAQQAATKRRREDDGDGDSPEKLVQLPAKIQRLNTTIQASSIQHRNITPSSAMQPRQWRSSIYPSMSLPAASDPNFAHMLSTPNGSPGPPFTNTSPNVYTQHPQQGNWQHPNPQWDIGAGHVHGLPNMNSNLPSPANFSYNLNSPAPYVSSPLAQRGQSQQMHTPAEQHQAFRQSPAAQLPNPVSHMPEFNFDLSHLSSESLAAMALPFQQQPSSELPAENTLWDNVQWPSAAPLTGPAITTAAEEQAWLSMTLPEQYQQQYSPSAQYLPQTYANIIHTGLTAHSAPAVQKALQQEQAAVQRRRAGTSAFPARNPIDGSVVRHLGDLDLTTSVITRFPSPRLSSPVNPIVRVRSSVDTPKPATIDPRLLWQGPHSPTIKPDDSPGPSPKDTRPMAD